MQCHLYSLRTLHEDEADPGLVEYLLILVLVAFAATAGMNKLASGLNSAFTQVGTILGSYVTYLGPLLTLSGQGFCAAQAWNPLTYGVDGNTRGLQQRICLWPGYRFCRARRSHHDPSYRELSLLQDSTLKDHSLHALTSRFA